MSEEEWGWPQVRLAAFQALGPFISTFADPSRTGLYCSEDGVVSVRQAGSCSGCMEGGPTNCPEGEEVQAQVGTSVGKGD